MVAQMILAQNGAIKSLRKEAGDLREKLNRAVARQKAFEEEISAVLNPSNDNDDVDDDNRMELDDSTSSSNEKNPWFFGMLPTFTKV